MSISEQAFNKMMKGSHAKIRGDSPVQTPNMESNSTDEIERPYADQAFSAPVNITIHSYRYRLADPDGISAKAAIDSIVKSGLLRDDSAKEVNQVLFRQTKIKKPDEEKTVILIEECI